MTYFKKLKWFLKVLLFASTIFFNVNSFAGVEFYQPGDYLNTLKRNQNLLEVFSDHWSKSWNTPEYLDVPILDEEKNKILFEKIKKEIHPADIFYYTTRGSRNAWIDLRLSWKMLEFPTNYFYNDFFQFFGALKFNVFNSKELKVDIGLTILNLSSEGGKNLVIEENSSIPYGELETYGSKDKSQNLAHLSDTAKAISIILRPYGYIHFGTISSSFSYDSPEKVNSTPGGISQNASFIESNFLNILFIFTQYDTTNKRSQWIKNKIEIMELLSALNVIKNRSRYPDVYLGFQYTNPDSELNIQAEDNIQYLTFADFFYNCYQAFYLDGSVKVLASGIRNGDQTYLFKEARLELGFNHQIFSSFIPGLLSEKPFNQAMKEYYQDSDSFFTSYYLIIGASYFSDDRLLDFGSSSPYTFGYRLGFRWEAVRMFAYFYVDFNYSRTLNTLIEGYNGAVIQGAFGFNF